MAEPTQTVIGFDLGSRWTGAAVGQTLTGQATPLRGFRHKDWNAIKKIISEWRPQLLIVGLPLDLHGEDQEMSARAMRFARQLEGRFGIRTELVDERLTTREAWQIALANEKRKSKTEIDCMAAALIVESWLRENQRPAC